jgi:hypothetical protein
MHGFAGWQFGSNGFGKAREYLYPGLLVLGADSAEKRKALEGDKEGDKEPLCKGRNY